MCVCRFLHLSGGCQVEDYRSAASCNVSNASGRRARLSLNLNLATKMERAKMTRITTMTRKKKRYANLGKHSGRDLTCGRDPQHFFPGKYDLYAMEIGIYAQCLFTEEGLCGSGGLVQDNP